MSERAMIEKGCRRSLQQLHQWNINISITCPAGTQEPDEIYRDCYRKPPNIILQQKLQYSVV